VFFAFFAVNCFPATVTGNLVDISLVPLDTKLTFTPTNLVLVTTAGLSAGPPRTIETTNGAFAITLDAGNYTVTTPLITWRAPFGLAVPPGAGTYNITNLLCAPASYLFIGNNALDTNAVLALISNTVAPQAMHATNADFSLSSSFSSSSSSSAFATNWTGLAQSNAYSGSFTGNGAALTNVPLSALQTAPLTNEDSLDATVETWYEPFGVGSKNVAAQIGVLGWQVNSSGGSINAVSAETGHHGIHELSSAGSGTGFALTLVDYNGLTVMPIAPLNAAANWQMRFIFRLTGTNFAQVHVGLAGTNYSLASTRPQTWAGLEYYAGSDPHFILAARSNSAQTNSTAVVADTNWHTLKLSSSVAGQWVMALDAAAPVTFSNSLPACGLSPLFHVWSAGAASPTLRCDEFMARFASLGR
jgi:hypothetical protein